MEGYTINITNHVVMPDVDYINDLAKEKEFSLGKSFNSTPKILDDLYYLFQQEKLDPEAFDVKDHLFASEYIEDKILLRSLTPQEGAYYKYTLLFLEKIEYGSVLGITPLDKALNVLMYLVHLSDSTNKKQKQKSEWDGQNDPNPGPINVENEEDLSKAIQEMSEGVKSSTSSQTGKQQDELSKEMTSCVRDHLYDLTPSIANIYGKNIPSDVPINKGILADIKIKAYLEGTKGLETALDTKKVKNNDSNEKAKFQMDTHSQITKIRKSEMLKENFDDKFIKKELAIKEKVKPETKKQMLYMLLDDSGSMGNLTKQTYVRAVLLNRLESVVDGKSELRFCLYESQRYEHHEVKDKLAAKKLYKNISLRRPHGGGTYIGNVLQETINEICNIPGYHDPEIMIVCDGDDYVAPDELDYKDVRINVVLLGTSNEGLEQIAKDTGGFLTVEKLYNRY